MQLIKILKSSGVALLGQSDGFRFRHRRSSLPGSRRFRSVWSISGQRSNCGASNLSDAPGPPLSCPDFYPHKTNKHPYRAVCFAGCCPDTAGRQVYLLSRERGSNAIADRAPADGFIAPFDPRLVANGALESSQLLNRKRDEKGLKHHEGLTQAGVQVIVACIYFIPHAFEIPRRSTQQGIRC